MFFTDCQNCQHEKVCSYKETFKARLKEIKELQANIAGSIFVITIVCKQYHENIPTLRKLLQPFSGGLDFGPEPRAWCGKPDPFEIARLEQQREIEKVHAMRGYAGPDPRECKCEGETV